MWEYLINVMIIFDCDGVLVDSEAIYCQVDAEALTGLGVPATAAMVSEQYAGVAHPVAWQQMARQFQLDLPDDWYEHISSECERRFNNELKAVPGAVDTVAALKEAGYSLCVASSSELLELTRKLSRTGLDQYLSPHIFSVSQVKRAKPAPDIFLYAAQQMGVMKKDIVVVEDSVSGVTAARQAGMNVIGFVGGGHAWPGLSETLVEAGASTAVASMLELKEHLFGRRSSVE